MDELKLDMDRFPYGNPTSEYLRHKGIDKPRHLFEQETEVSNHDMLCAMLLSADAKWDELRRIRVMMEKDRGQ